MWLLAKLANMSCWDNYRNKKKSDSVKLDIAAVIVMTFSLWLFARRYISGAERNSKAGLPEKDWIGNPGEMGEGENIWARCTDNSRGKYKVSIFSVFKNNYVISFLNSFTVFLKLFQIENMQL